ncbi:MAG TPA: hypothetical protein VLF93_06510 [Candidatus Saccharimonadales bacterium]|nr:hypothetical protein [Candidatus Saccharimonadales bacterium]
MFKVLLACTHLLSVFFFHQHVIKHHQYPTTNPTPTVVMTPAPTSTISGEPTATPTIDITTTPTPTLTPTPTVMISGNPTETPIPTSTPTPTISITPTMTLTPTPTASMTPTMTLTPTPTATDTPTMTLTPTPTASETPTPTPDPTKIGNDISYPQCNKTLPTGQRFGIVGVNGGIAVTTNPCLSTQLLWANQSTGSTPNQNKVQLYVNTGNPGGLNTPSWPTNNTDPAGNVAPNPDGTCDGSDSLACSWQYGWNRAVDDVQNRFVPNAQAAAVDTNPSDYPWWLDVETVNSWESGSDDALKKNVADLEGMIAYFQSRSITAGIYSTSSMWSEIVGNDVTSDSKLNGLRSWVPGASDVNGAQANCKALSAITSGGTLVLTQYTTNNLDYDYSCL